MAEKTHPTDNKFLDKHKKDLFDLAYKTILELRSPLGINASGKEDRFATFFGRDSMITGLKLLRVYKKNRDKIFLQIISDVLKTASRLQGKTINPLSGEETGKIIHEYREGISSNFMVKEAPWYTYPDKTLRNYDSIDATPLFLILAAEYYKLTRDEKFLKDILLSAQGAFYWINTFGNIFKGDTFLEYRLDRPAPYGGLVNQGWMDSEESLLIYGEPPKEPVALVEVQGYYFKALRLWAEIFEKIDEKKSKELRQTSNNLRREFNKFFILRTEGLHYFAQAIFSGKAQILERRSNPGHCLWSSVETKGRHESIIDEKYIPDVVNRLMRPDLFDPNGGIRTLTTKSIFFNPCSYHNGSIWPFDNGIIAEGFENFGFSKESLMIKSAVLKAMTHFNSTVELYCLKDGKVAEYREGNIRASKKQAWTAATILDFTT